MASTADLPPDPELMTRNEAALGAYRQLWTAISGFEGVSIEEKKTSLHVVAGKAAFLGVHVRKAGIRLNIVLARRLDGARIVKAEQVSKSRFHNEVDLRPNGPLDDEVVGWIREAYDLQQA